MSQAEGESEETRFEAEVLRIVIEHSRPFAPFQTICELVNPLIGMQTSYGISGALCSLEAQGLVSRGEIVNGMSTWSVTTAGMWAARNYTGRGKVPLGVTLSPPQTVDELRALFRVSE